MSSKNRSVSATEVNRKREKTPLKVVNAASSSNFIGTSKMQLGPRAVVISETGERRTIDEVARGIMLENEGSGDEAASPTIQRIETQRYPCFEIPIAPASERPREHYVRRSSCRRINYNSKGRLPLCTVAAYVKIAAQQFYEQQQLQNKKWNTDANTQTDDLELEEEPLTLITPENYTPPLVGELENSIEAMRLFRRRRITLLQYPSHENVSCCPGCKCFLFLMAVLALILILCGIWTSLYGIPDYELIMEYFIKKKEVPTIKELFFELLRRIFQ